ncbi:hypothetical protein V1478_009555 [Vespula squamosa]|uniref:Uncharacterized protein n=1 Tax=Vespula squamosa TaxID=30214 RepID=A0ABD2AQW3_VESSQ
MREGVAAENVHPRQARCGSGDGGGGGRELAPRTDQYLKHRERPVARTKSFYLTTTANEDIIYPSFVANVAGLNSPAPIESERIIFNFTPTNFRRHKHQEFEGVTKSPVWKSGFAKS